MVDYTKFKTPFFEVEIGDSTNSRKVKLPHHILRLIQKVEITESMKKDPIFTINLDFLEGSREPASRDAQVGTQGLYKVPNSSGAIDMAISGSITNRTGSVTDLRFSGSGGITFITAEEAATATVDNTPQETVEGKIKTRVHKGEPKAPRFLLQERNIVKVTWGYLEDPQTVRSVVGRIAVINVEYPDSNQTRTSVVCNGAKVFLDQLSPCRGIPLGTIERNGSSVVIQPTDKNIKEVIEDLCDKLGLACIVSENIPVNKLDAEHQKVWMAGESFNELMERYAEENDARYDIIYDTKTEKDTLVFLSNTDFLSKPITNSVQLFRYGAPGTILKSVRLTSDFGAMSGSSFLGISKEAEQVCNTVRNGSDETVVGLFRGKQEEVIDKDPTSGTNPVPSAVSAESEFKTVSGKVENSPKVDDEANIESSAKIEDQKLQASITGSISTLGFPGLFPGLIHIDNIGVRYSGTYEVLSVKHLISTGGYTSEATITSNTVATGGVKVSEAAKSEEPEQVDVQLFQPKPNIRRSEDPANVQDTQNTPLDRYKSLQESK